MRRLVTILLLCISSFIDIKAQQFSVNNDGKTITAMQTTYGIASAVESNTTAAFKEILDHYSKAGLSSSGIYASKYLDRKAMKNAGRFSDAERNYYYKRIAQLVAQSIMPRIISVATLCLQYPDRALFWGPYLYKVTEDVKNLCMQFECVVCNGTITFQDLVFFCISDDLKQYFDLIKLGDVDWSNMFNSLGDFVGGLSLDDLKQDIDDVLKSSAQIGGGLASASGDFFNQALDTVSTAGKKAFSFKLKDMKSGFKNFKAIYKDYSDGSKIKDEIMGKLGGTDSLALTKLFKIDNYNTTRYMMQFWDEFRGKYYKQRYYIAWRDQGREVLCDYSPPTSPNEEITKGRQWVRFATDQQSMVLTSEQLKTVQTNSEHYAGWSESQVKQMNAKYTNDKYNYEFIKSLSRYYIHRSGKVISNAFAYSIYVYRWWNVVEEVYEEVFDSYNMDINTFLAKMNGKVNEMNTTQTEKSTFAGFEVDKDASNPRKYYLACDDKLYYEETDANKLKGCESVDFVLECNETNEFANSTFSWKENGKHNHKDVRDDTRKYAMSSNAGECSTSEMEDQLSQIRSQIESTNKQLSQVQTQINKLEILLGYASSTESESIKKELEEAKKQMASLENDKKSLENQLQQGNQSLQEIAEDCEDELNGPYRIPNAMLEVERAFDIRWTDDGSWNGNQFVRHGILKTMSNSSNTDIVFTADLSVTRGESHLFGIRIHRAIIKVSWKVVGYYKFKEVIDVMALDPTAEDKIQSKMVNERLHELQKENPGCVVNLEYHYQEEVEKDKEDSPHLLWVSDRLEIARNIEYRLSRINAQLILNEKFLRQRLSIKNYLIHQLFDGLSNGSRARFGGLAYRRWRSAAKQIAQGTKPNEIEIENEE